MDLIFFDLDGTLLNDKSTLTPFTLETLKRLNDRNIAFTVATGRSMLSAQQTIALHHFRLPHIYNNGVTIWDPANNDLTFENLLATTEVLTITECAAKYQVAPFVNTIDLASNSKKHIIYHGPLRHQIEQNLVNNYLGKTDAELLPLSAMHIGAKYEKNIKLDSHITNISMIGDAHTIYEMWQYLNQFDSLVAYSGPATEGHQYSWMDVHHRLANKGSAVLNLKNQLGATNIICFGDSENDMSMFELADECYAPENVKEMIRKKADAIIGHHAQDGIAHFLRERFEL